MVFDFNFNDVDISQSWKFYLPSARIIRKTEIPRLDAFHSLL